MHTDIGIKAYLGAEANHFEARGTRLTVAWRPPSQTTLALLQAGASYTLVQMRTLDVHLIF